jgi:hypothetical protein
LKERQFVMVEQETNIAGLRREWLAARIFAILGALVLVTIVVLAVLLPPRVVAPQQPRTAAIQRQMAIALCNAGLASAQGFALVPAYTKLASDLVQVGTVKGRYTCFAQTDAARYQITFDLMCRDLNKPKCVNLYSVMQDGGAAIYQRR